MPTVAGNDAGVRKSRASAPAPPTPLPRWGRGEISGEVLGLESPSYGGGTREDRGKGREGRGEGIGG